MSRKSGLFRPALGGASLIVLALALVGARWIGWIGEGLPERIMGVVFGIMVIVNGNSIPKKLTPLARLSCEPSRKQAAQRFAGRALVVIGLLSTVAWVAAPVKTAAAIVTGVGVTGILLIWGRCYLARRSGVSSAAL